MKQYIERSELVSRIYKYVELTNPEEQEWVKDECIRQAHAMPSVNVGEWISVDERLPDNCRAVLVALEGLTIGGAPAMVIGSYSGGFWMIADADGTHYLTKYMRFVVTHWMPLPEPPVMKGGEVI